MAPLRARLTPAQGEPAIGEELIDVHHPDGRVERVRLHDYARVYALPGVYEQIVQEDLGCRSPAKVAELLRAAAQALGWAPEAVRVIDLAAGNGVSGEALRAAGPEPVLGIDVVPEARTAALRDRPGLYGEYRTLDLTALSAAERRELRALEANALCCVAPVGEGHGRVPPAALAAGAALLADDALVVHLHDPRHGEADPIDAAFWAAAPMDPVVVGAERLAAERYLHRFTVSGAPYEIEAALWHVRRDDAGGRAGRTA